jgi:DNA-binding beta-propeller fold protein YncE
MQCTGKHIVKVHIGKVSVAPARLVGTCAAVCTLVVLAMTTNSCVPREIVINPPESDWQLLALSPEPQSRLVVFNQPANTLANNNLFAVLGASGIGGRVSKIVPFREHIYVFLPEQRRIEVLSSATYMRRTTLDFSQADRIPSDIVFANATTGYIAFSNTSVVSVLDITVFRVVSDIQVGQGPVELEVQENQIYCALQRDNALAIIDSRLNAVTARLPMPTAPTFLGLTPNGRFLMVVSAGAGKFDNAPRTVGRVTFVELATRRVVSQSPLSTTLDSLTDTPRGLAITERDFAFIPLNNTLIRFETRRYTPSLVRTNVQFRTITYNPVRAELLLLDSARSGCVVADIETGQQNAFIPLPFRASLLISR